MLALIEKILADACETGNEAAAAAALCKLRKKYGHGDIAMDESTTQFARMCCYAVHELYPTIGVEVTLQSSAIIAPISEMEHTLTLMLIDIIFLVDRLKHLKRYLSVPIHDVAGRVKTYRKLHRRWAEENGYQYFEPAYVASAASAASYDGDIVSAAPATTTTSTISTKLVGGRQLVTIKTIIEHEISMYIDVDVVCPKFVKICMPHLEDPIYISKVMKKYVTFAKIFDGKAKENTLSYYYKYNNNESVLEFIDEDMESEVADILGVKILEKEIVDEEEVLVAAAQKNRLTDEQVADFKAQLEEVRWNIRHAV